MRTFVVGGKALCVSIFGLDQILKLCHEYTVTAVHEETLTIELETGIELTAQKYKFIPVVE